LTELNICLKLAFVPKSSDDPTRLRVLRAAGELFAARGFHATTVRDIALRARVNLASGHYHFGSKRALYLAVLRQQFAAVRAELARRGAVTVPQRLRRLGGDELTALLHARLRAMLDLLIGNPASLHATLMQREMADPSAALPVIVREFITPLMGEIEVIVRRLEPRLSRAAATRCARSIVGQALFYRFAMPIVLRIMKRSHYPAGMIGQLAAHVTTFSLGGLRAVAAQPGLRRRAALPANVRQPSEGNP
jgi:AcrR family transcriptional regulator